MNFDFISVELRIGDSKFAWSRSCLSDGGSGSAAGSQMQTQNPIKLGNGLGQLTRSVGAGNDLLGLGTIEMRAPVSYDAIAAVRATALSAVADDRVIGSADRRFLDYRLR